MVLLFFFLGSGTTSLQAGRHTFPFVYTLPPNLPSSFESYIGSVRYMLKCKIDKPWKFDHVTKKMFTVVSILDLNQEPSAMVSLDQINPVPNKPWFLRVCSTSLLRTL